MTEYEHKRADHRFSKFKKRIQDVGKWSGIQAKNLKIDQFYWQNFRSFEKWATKLFYGFVNLFTSILISVILAFFFSYSRDEVIRASKSNDKWKTNKQTKVDIELGNFFFDNLLFPIYEIPNHTHAHNHILIPNTHSLNQKKNIILILSYKIFKKFIMKMIRINNKKLKRRRKHHIRTLKLHSHTISLSHTYTSKHKF